MQIEKLKIKVDREKDPNVVIYAEEQAVSLC
jgi:hypothetical protein